MNATQQPNVFAGLMLAGLSMLVAGCGSQAVQGGSVAKYPPGDRFEIVFTPNKVVITPNRGYGMFYPRRGYDNTVKWSSNTKFIIEFTNIEDPTMPPPAPFPTGPVDATEANGKWEFSRSLEPQTGDPDLRAVKYSVTHHGGAPKLDPVLIVRR